MTNNENQIRSEYLKVRISPSALEMLRAAARRKRVSLSTLSFNILARELAREARAQAKKNGPSVSAVTA